MKSNLFSNNLESLKYKNTKWSKGLKDTKDFKISYYLDIFFLIMLNYKQLKRVSFVSYVVNILNI